MVHMLTPGSCRAASSGSMVGGLQAAGAVDLAHQLSELNIAGLQQQHSASEESNSATPFTTQRGMSDLADLKPHSGPGAPGVQF